MKASDAFKSAAWAAAGAVLVGGGIFLGFTSALLRRRETSGAEPGPRDGSDSAAPDQRHLRSINELAQAVADLQKRMDAARPPPPQALADRLETVSSRVEQLERRIEQLASETPVLAVDQILAAVEHMVATKVGGLDERLTDQVHAIEMLRNASTQTDALLQKLIHAVEALADQTAEKAPEPAREDSTVVQRDYPIA